MNGLRVLTVGVLLAAVPVFAAACNDSGDGSEITASGTIDADTTVISSLYGGRIVEILVDEGDAAEKDDVLVRFDSALIDAQIDEAEAALVVAEAQLDQVTAEARPEEIRGAEAALAGAVAQWNGARQAWQNARALAGDPQELEGQLVDASTQVSLAEVRVAHAEDALATAQERFDSATGSEAEIAAARLEAADAALDQARAGQAGAEQALANLLELRENPIQALAVVKAAEAAFKQAGAAVEASQARLDMLEAGATGKEVAAAEANVRQAEAARDALQAQGEQLVLRAPVDGLVISRSAEVGEIALPGATLVRLANLDRVDLIVFVPETEIGDVAVGQSVDVEVDAFPDDSFHGEVTFIATEPEFTPRNVQTKDQRANLVFAVTVSLDNEDHRLRPGMPADATLDVD